MECHIKAMVNDTVEKPKEINRDQWIETYDPRGKARDELKKLRNEAKKYHKKPSDQVYLLNRKGEQIEVSGQFHTQCGLTSGVPRYKL